MNRLPQTLPSPPAPSWLTGAELRGEFEVNQLDCTQQYSTYGTTLVAAIIRNLGQKTQLQSVQKSVENLVNLHAAGMVQLTRCRCPPVIVGLRNPRLYCDHCCLIVLVGAFEIGDLVIILEVPDAG